MWKEAIVVLFEVQARYFLGATEVKLEKPHSGLKMSRPKFKSVNSKE
jgi:hypothetical protein